MMSKIIVVAVIWVITTHFIVQQSVETIRTELKSIEHKNKRLASNNNQLEIENLKLSEQYHEVDKLYKSLIKRYRLTDVQVIRKTKGSLFHEVFKN